MADDDDVIELGCPASRNLGPFRSAAAGEGRSDREAKLDAIQNAVDKMMVDKVPIVLCGEDCEVVFTVDIRPGTFLNARQIGPKKYKGIAKILADVSVKCVDEPVKPGGHVVIDTHGILEAR